MPLVFTDTYLNKVLDDAEKDAVNKLDYLFHRFTINVTQGTSTYVLPDFVRKIMRVTWLGHKVDPITWQEMAVLTPNSFVGVQEASEGKPRWYCLHPNGLRTIRFYPTPNQTIAADDSGVMGPTIASTVVISCFRAPILGDDNWTMPPYIKRRMSKAYGAMRALEREGKGQNLTASQYYAAKLEWLYRNFRLINEGVFVSKRPRLNATLEYQHSMPKRPQLPFNFGVRDPWGFS